MRFELLCVAAVSLACTATALGHHSFAMFDQEKKVSIEGVVKEMEWTNPHAWLHVTAIDAAGKTVDWSFEMGGINQIIQRGWARDTVKPGDKITVLMHPLKDGSRGGQYLAATLANGRVIEEFEPNAGSNVPGAANR